MDNAHDLTVRLRDLLRDEHGAMADFLVVLSDFDRQGLWAQLGYASLFDFLVRELGLSRSAASFRKKAAELIQRYPEIVEPLRDGRLCLSGIFEVAKVLTPENRDEVLPRFFLLGKREAKAIAAAIRPDPAPALRTTITPVRGSDPTAAMPPLASSRVEATPEASGSLRVASPAKQPDANSALTPQEEPAPAPARGQAAAAPSRETRCEPLTGELSRLGVTVSRRFLDKLAAARDALSHSRPGASVDEILEAGLDLLLARDARRKGIVDKPRREPPAASSDPDYVPAHVRRAVWKRDGGKCQWPVESGGICGSTVRPQLDHLVPRALGGASTIDNLRVCCAFHNDRAAREVYGDGWMDRYTRGPRAGEPVAPWGVCEAPRGRRRARTALTRRPERGRPPPARPRTAVDS